MRARNTPFFLVLMVLMVLSGSCVQPMSGRLAPSELPDLVGVEPDIAASRGAPGDRGAGGSHATASGTGTGSGAGISTAAATAGIDAATAPSGSAGRVLAPVPPAVFEEGQVFRFVDELLADDRRRLAAVGPGTTLVDRLRYCLCRFHLDLAAETLPELQRLSRQHADNPVVWRLLGVAYQASKRDDNGAEREHRAIEAYRRCYELDRQDAFKTSPTITRYLGNAMLRSPAHRAAGIKFLREELAHGPKFVYAAVTLSTFFKQTEDYVQCLATLDAGLGRDPDSHELTFYKGLAILEQHRLDQAIEIFTPLSAHPVYGMEATLALARAYSLGGRFDQALVQANRLLATEPLSARARERFTNLRNRIVKAQKTGASRRPVWECWVILRGHKSIKLRRQVLAYLAKQAPEVASVALKIAGNSDNPLLRAEALRYLVWRAIDPLDDLRSGFSDRAARVRAMAADLSVALAEKLQADKKTPTDTSSLVAMVLKALAVEADPYAFRSMHAALQSLTGASIEIPFGGTKDPDQRAAIVRAWRERW